ncbi:MAG: hypothetical protein ABIA04_08445 [Pseudomonadota bacterium]
MNKNLIKEIFPNSEDPKSILLGLYFPNKDRYGNIIKDISEWINKAQTLLGHIANGSNQILSKSSWFSGSEKKLIFEDTIIVTSFLKAENQKACLRAIKTLLFDFGKKTNQEVVAFEYCGDFIQIPIEKLNKAQNLLSKDYITNKGYLNKEYLSKEYTNRISEKVKKFSDLGDSLGLNAYYNYDINVFCKLCGYFPIKEVFTLQNLFTKLTIDLGNKCILNYQEAFKNIYNENIQIYFPPKLSHLAASINNKKPGAISIDPSRWDDSKLEFYMTQDPSESDIFPEDIY